MKKPVEKQKSQRLCVHCRNHNIKAVVSGHKKVCKYKNCGCNLCELTNHVKAVSLKERKFHRAVDRIVKGFVAFESAENSIQVDETAQRQVETTSDLSEMNFKIALPEINGMEAASSNFTPNCVFLKEEFTTIDDQINQTEQLLSLIESETMEHDQQEMIETCGQWEDWMQCLNL